MVNFLLISRNKPGGEQGTASEQTRQRISAEGQVSSIDQETCCYRQQTCRDIAPILSNALACARLLSDILNAINVNPPNCPSP